MSSVTMGLKKELFNKCSTTLNVLNNLTCVGSAVALYKSHTEKHICGLLSATFKPSAQN